MDKPDGASHNHAKLRLFGKGNAGREWKTGVIEPRAKWRSIIADLSDRNSIVAEWLPLVKG